MTSTTSSGNPIGNPSMTLKTHSKSHQFFSVIGWSLKKMVPSIILYTLLLFLSFPFVVIISNFVFNSVAIQNQTTTFADALTTIVLAFPFSSGAIVTLFSLIFSMMMFTYFNNKRRVDMFGSMPITRRLLFFARYTTALIALIVPFLLIWGISLGLCSSSPVAMQSLLNTLLPFLLMIFSTITFSAFICLCCGTTVDALISIVIINAFVPLMIFLCMNTAFEMLPGYSLNNANLSASIFTVLTPFFWIFQAGLTPFWNSSIISPYGTTASTAGFITKPDIIYQIIFIALFFLGCFICSRRRKAEAAQSGFAFKLPSYLIRFVATVTTGVGFGYILGSINADSSNLSLFWFWLGFAIGSFISHFTITLIYGRGIKGFAKSLIQYGSTCAITVIFSVLLMFGWFGADTYKPNLNDISHASFSFSDSLGYSTYSSSLYSNSSNNKNNYEIKDSGIIEQLLQMQDDAITAERSKGYPYDMRNVFYSNYDYNDGYYHTFNLLYTLKSGEEVSRTYYVNDEFIDNNRDTIESIYQSKELRLASRIFDEKTTDKYDNLFLYIETIFSSHSIDINEKAKMRELIEALKTDILADDNYIETLIGIPERNTFYLSFNFSYYVYDGTGMHESIIESVPINRGYVNTITFLIENGFFNDPSSYNDIFGELIDRQAEQSFINEMSQNALNKMKADSEGEIVFTLPSKWGDKVYCQLYDSSSDMVLSPLFSIYDECTVIDGTAVYKYNYNLMDENGEEFMPDTITFYDSEGNRSTSLYNPLNDSFDRIRASANCKETAYQFNDIKNFKSIDYFYWETVE